MVGDYAKLEISLKVLCRALLERNLLKNTTRLKRPPYIIYTSVILISTKRQ